MFRLLLTIISFLFLLTISCNSPHKKNNENSVDSVKQTIHTLRSIGFFRKYESLSNEQLFDTLHQQRIAEHSKMFKEFYDPGMKLEKYEVLMLDQERAVYGDAESDVGKDNNQYVSLLKIFSEASAGYFQPTEIIETWETENGPIHVSFKEKGEEIKFDPTYHDDWLSEEVFDIINQQMIKNGHEKFYMYLGKDGLGLGQFFLYIRLTESQKQALENTFGWKFSK
ncbi:hypothetical protein IQ13_0221 [Lacibacter cauensis]|uniref:Lipoprotein n=1 Tax=Lacibacter cauensis TaxID=510947 RepID=A0A562SW84_9BACT|nr:hypothetical protein [Lacibacter cauensis]TWI85066.1 hypothetical protein IQ13_0221 [Lacibacter cauensis]